MANKDNNKEGFSKMSINWYIPTYGKLLGGQDLL